MMMRFIVDDAGTLIDMQTRDMFDIVEEVCPLLNEQHEEIGRLKQKMEKVYNSLIEENEQLKSKYSEQCIQLDFLKDENQHMRDLVNENKQLKSQLYCDDEEGVCNICKHHYLVKDDEAELGYYNSRCKKGHNYECARFSLKHCKDFEKEV